MIPPHCVGIALYKSPGNYAFFVCVLYSNRVSLKLFFLKINLSLENFLSGLRMVQPGRLVSSAQKYAWRKRRVGAHQSGNLGQVASVITGRRVYNLEFTDYSDLKAFYNVVEAVFAVTLLTS